MMAFCNSEKKKTKQSNKINYKINKFETIMDYWKERLFFIFFCVENLKYRGESFILKCITEAILLPGWKKTIFLHPNFPDINLLRFQSQSFIYYNTRIEFNFCARKYMNGWD